MSMVWPGYLRLVMVPVIHSTQRSSGMLTSSSQPPTLQSSQMAATLLMHQLQRLIPTSATRHNGDIQDVDQDMVATCQRHTRCSASYCLRTKHGKQEKQECRLGYPKPLQPHIVTEV